MVEGSSAVRDTSCADVYVPPVGDAVVVGGVLSGILVSMVYTSVFAVSSFPAVSTARKLSVVVVGIEMAAVYVLLDVVTAEPSMVKYMVAVSSGVRDTSCADVYVPPVGDAVVVGAVESTALITLTNLVTSGVEFSAASITL